MLKRIGLLLTLIIVALVVLGSWRPFQSTATSFPAAGVTTLQVNEGVTGLTVTTGDRVQVAQTIRSWLPGSMGRITRNNGTLILDGCGWFCQVQYEVTVPVGTDLSGRMAIGDVTAANVGAVHLVIATGDVQLSGPTGEVVVQTGTGQVQVTSPKSSTSVTTGTGRITITNASGPVTATTGTGQITITDAGGPVTATTGTGEVAATLSTPTSANIKTGTGAVTLRVPSGSYRVQVFTSSRQQIGIPIDSSSPHLLTVTTGTGSVTIESR